MPPALRVLCGPAFGDRGLEETASILRLMRDFFIEKFGLETADKILPSDDVNRLQGPADSTYIPEKNADPLFAQTLRQKLRPQEEEIMDEKQITEMTNNIIAAVTGANLDRYFVNEQPHTPTNRTTARACTPRAGPALALLRRRSLRMLVISSAARARPLPESSGRLSRAMDGARKPTGTYLRRGLQPHEHASARSSAVPDRVT